MNRHSILAALGIALTVIVAVGCSEKVDTSSRYVFSEYTIASYLESHDVYSEYVDILRSVPMSKRSNSSVYQLLTARGNYTVFAPTNEAIAAYLQQLTDEGLITAPSWDAFPNDTKRDSIRAVIAHNSILDGGDLTEQVYYLANFPTGNNAEFPLPNLADHRLSVYIPAKASDVYINKTCVLDERNIDIPALNGVIHQIHSVIAPDDLTAARYLRRIIDERTDGYLVMAKLIEACGLMDTLGAVRDEVYELLYQTGQIPNYENYMTKGWSDASGNSESDAIAPEHRKYGFTIFAEDDDFWRSQGIEPTASDVPQRVTQWIRDNGMYLTDYAPTFDDNYLSEDNALNQWTTYHILPTRIEPSKLVIHWNETGYSRGRKVCTIPVMEWYCTMGKRRLIKLYESYESQGVYANRFPRFSHERTSDGHEVYCLPERSGSLIHKESEKAVVSDIINACIYPISKPLVYNSETRDNMGRERLRFDCFALFPEAFSNDIRRAESALDKYNHVYIPSNAYYQYFSNMSILSEDSHFIHFNGYNVNWENYDGDEDKLIGRYDVMFTLPPVPKRGTYELRYKVLATAVRGTVQIYFGSNKKNLPVAGIPVDLTKTVKDLWGQNAIVDDTEDEDYNAEIDKKLRNNGLMKASKAVASGSSLGSERGNNVCSRRIVWRGTMDPNLTYHVRFKSVLDSDTKEFYIDYLELCPKEVYDNPEEPEDLY